MLFHSGSIEHNYDNHCDLSYKVDRLSTGRNKGFVMLVSVPKWVK